MFNGTLYKHQFSHFDMVIIATLTLSNGSSLQGSACRARVQVDYFSMFRHPIRAEGQLLYTLSEQPDHK